MKVFTQAQIDKIPMILKCHWYEQWVKEQNKPKDYIGRLAILKRGKSFKDSKWITEGIDFVIEG